MNPASTSLLTEHLRWTPLSLIDDIINTVNTLLYTSVTAVENFLLNSPPALLGFSPPAGTIPDTDDDGNIVYSAKEAEEINTGIHQLETLLENGVDKCFDRFELYVLRNILVVQPDLVGWVRLAHHKDLDFSNITLPTPDSTTPPATTPPAHEAHSRLRTLRQTLLASHALNATLTSEIATNTRTLSQLRALVSTSSTNPLPILASSPKETKDSASFAVSQADLIRTLVARLRPEFEALKRRGGEDTVVADAPEEERKKYIERMTRRHMEASRGLRLNAKGEVVGGDFESAKKGLGEVEALEGVVGGLEKEES